MRLLTLFFALVLTISLQAQDTGSLMVGAAKVDITPQESDLEVATDMIRDQLFVRAIYIQDGENSAVLVSADVGGMGNNIMEIALPKSSASTGTPITNYVVSATHTHSSNTGGIRGDSPPTNETVANAIVRAVDMAKSKLQPARVGYGTTELDLNVNRDNFNAWQEWRQEPNFDGVSDKTLSVVQFLGEDDVPIAVYMNYGMHPVNFFRSGVISADFPGDASAYVEELFDNRTVALFSQAPSGDQNPKLAYSSIFREGPITAVLPPHQPPNQGNPRPATVAREAVAEDNLTAYKKSIERKSDYVQMLGHMIGSSAVRVMLYDMELRSDAGIWAGQKTITCPGRTRLDNSKRENYDPGYAEGEDVNILVGLLKIGDIYMVTVNGEVYTEIGQRLKAESPANNTMMVTLANGRANSGYIYSNNATYHQTFQVLGSRLQPGCAEEGITSAAIELIRASQK